MFLIKIKNNIKILQNIKFYQLKFNSIKKLTQNKMLAIKIAIKNLHKIIFYQMIFNSIKKLYNIKV